MTIDEQLAVCQSKVADLERTLDGLAHIYEVNKEFHWRLVDLFDKEVSGVSPLHYLEEHIPAALRRVAELERFKAYVHKRLDDAGIATHPDGPHSKEGCRVGDRLDIALHAQPEADCRLISGLARDKANLSAKLAAIEAVCKADGKSWPRKVGEILAILEGK